MKKLIGGLLTLSLLSQPLLLRVAGYAHVERSRDKMFAVVRDLREFNIPDCKAENVSDLMQMVYDNNEQITAMLKKKNKSLTQMQNKMAAKALTKVAMTEEQMTAYKCFNDYYELQQGFVSELLALVQEKMALKDTQQEIMNSNTNYNDICDDLSEICFYQSVALDTLIRTVDMCDELVVAL